MGNGYKGEQKRSCPELLRKKVSPLANCKETPELKPSQAFPCLQSDGAMDQAMEPGEPSPSVGRWGTGTAQGGSARARAGACGVPGRLRPAWRAADPSRLLQTPSVY